ncbi:hypothetical protein [Corynebacterium occultum]|nr:hypothetical protein [Corynebacterium occultum]
MTETLAVCPAFPATRQVPAKRWDEIIPQCLGGGRLDAAGLKTGVSGIPAAVFAPRWAEVIHFPLTKRISGDSSRHGGYPLGHQDQGLVPVLGQLAERAERCFLVDQPGASEIVNHSRSVS